MRRGWQEERFIKDLNKREYSNLLTPNRSEIDLSNTTLVNNWFKDKKPDVVILAAAKVGGILDNSDIPLNFY